MRVSLPLLTAALATSAATASSSPHFSSRRQLSDSSAQRHRDLSMTDYWYTLLNKIHLPCPPGHTEDHPLGHCAHESFHGPGHHSSKSGGGSNSSSKTSEAKASDAKSSSSEKAESSSTYDSSSATYDADSAEISSWTNDGYDDAKSVSGYDDAYSGDESNTYDASGYDDTWHDDGYWKNSNLDGSGYGNQSSQSNRVSAWPFVLGAVVVGTLIALVIAKKRRQDREDDHPLEGSVKKRMRLFNGGIFRRNRGDKATSLADESTLDDGTSFDDIEDGSAPGSYVEIDESVQTPASSKMSRGSSFRGALSRVGSKLNISRTRSGAQPEGAYSAPSPMGFDNEGESNYVRQVEL